MSGGRNIVINNNDKEMVKFEEGWGLACDFRINMRTREDRLG